MLSVHLNNVLNKVKKNRLNRLHNLLSRSTLITKYKVIQCNETLNNEHLQYLLNFAPVISTLYSTRNALNIPLWNFKKKYFFFHLLPLNETNLILALEKPRVCQLLRLISFSSSPMSTFLIMLKVKFITKT